MSKTCQECGGKCCRYFCFEIDEPDTYEEFEDVRWYLLHEGVTVHIDDDDWFISIDNRCNMLADDNSCTAYDDRPLICRKYDPSECDFVSGDYGYEEHFVAPEDIDEYARETLGEKEYEAAKRKARAKLARKPIKKKSKV